MNIHLNQLLETCVDFVAAVSTHKEFHSKETFQAYEAATSVFLDAIQQVLQDMGEHTIFHAASTPAALIRNLSKALAEIIGDRL